MQVPDKQLEQQLNPSPFSRFGANLGRIVQGVGTLGMSEMVYQERERKAMEEEANRQALAKIIASPMTPDQKMQALASLGTTDAVNYAMQLSKPEELPASVREFQAVQSLPAEQRQAFQEFRNPITPYQREQLNLDRQKLESGADYQRTQATQRAQQLELQARALEQAGRKQEAAAVRQEAQAIATIEPRKLSATEQKEFYEAEEKAVGSESVIAALNDALALNDKAFSGFGAETRAYLNRVPFVEMLIDDEGAVATTELSNIILGQALESLKATFGAAPTEGERKILLDLQASVDKTPKEREAVLKRAIAAAERRSKNARAKMQGITTGGIYGNAPIVAEEGLVAPNTPQGMTQVGTSGGRPVYQDAQGNLFMEE